MSDLTTAIQGFRTHAFDRIKEHSDYFQEVTGWMQSMTVDSSATEKALPYFDAESYRATLRLGSRLFHESMLAKTIHENLLSYLVGTGHTYTVEKIGAVEDKEDETTLRAMQAIDAMMSFYEWPNEQEEFYNRWFRSGDTLRAIEPIGKVVQFSFIEPHQVVPPQSTKFNAPFGIEYRNGNVNDEVRYWINDGQKVSPVNRVTPTQVISHGKRGVDRNDPRGIPLLWLTYCPAREIDELDSALSKIMAAVSEHAIVYDYNPDVTNAAIQNVADGATRSRKKAAAGGKMVEKSGGTHHATNHRVQVNGATINGTDWVQVLQAKRRSIGVIAGLPEFIVTGDADSGTRNTLFMAEAPLTRRISREARRGAAHEIEVLYQAIAVEFGKFGDEAWLKEFRSKYKIVPKYALAEAQDKAAETSRILASLDKKVLSPQIACRMVGENYDQVQADWDAHYEREQSRREQLGGMTALAADDIRVRAEIAQTLINRGIDANQALEYVGLDSKEFGSLVIPKPEPSPQPGGGTNQPPPDRQRPGQAA